jgi:hypothetical protein
MGLQVGVFEVPAVDRHNMSVYVDPIREVQYGRWKYACHMIADTVEELHAMAKAIGMQEEWFQPKSFPHYDLLRPRRETAVKLGAIELDKRPFIHRLRSIRQKNSPKKLAKDQPPPVY